MLSIQKKGLVLLLVDVLMIKNFLSKLFTICQEEHKSSDEYS